MDWELNSVTINCGIKALVVLVFLEFPNITILEIWKSCSPAAACTCVCTHRHWMSLEMLEGICVTSALSWWQMRWVPFIELVSTPGLLSISEPGTEAAAVFIITFISIMRIITIISAVGPQWGLLYFKFEVLKCHCFFFFCRSCFVSVFPACVYVHAGLPPEPTLCISHEGVCPSVHSGFTSKSVREVRGSSVLSAMQWWVMRACGKLYGRMRM